MTCKEIKKELKAIIKSAEEKNEFYQYEEDGEEYEQLFLGSFMSLDPCGKFHCMLVPNEPTKKCDRYWYNLNKAAEELGGWLGDSNGDFCDVMFNRFVKKEAEE
jgi:hypothetical protein